MPVKADKRKLEDQEQQDAERPWNYFLANESSAGNSAP